ncbi:hypothetical protein [Thermoactinospora rubra]|uniref:hypothetical protein n=1 Tax=Thermoactinospora rubra TaxID=1088767 RepID=UPI00117E74E2|nr:hypothetical protein [Thermoactinospora rubra]
MLRRLSSRAVGVGALAALSSVVLAACSTGAEYQPERQTVTEQPPVAYPGEDETDETGEIDEVVATCVVRDSEDDGVYLVAPDDECDGAGKHSAYMWYYGGRRIAGRQIHRGTTTRPRDAWIVTRGGDELSRTGRIVRDGFGNRTTVGS